jgi:aminoglycoside 2'-N-acetyltransferase I
MTGEALAHHGGVQTLHTADLDDATRAAVRTLLAEAFGADYTEHDWEHGLGGMHALVWQGNELVGHGAVVQRRLLHPGPPGSPTTSTRALRTGYVEGMAVRVDRRSRGYGRAVLVALERVIRGGYELGALAATEEAMDFYTACGWRRWRGPTFALTPTGIIRTKEDDDCVFVLPVTAPVDLSGELICDWRDGDVW